jgi:hypothetical protein
VIDALSYATNNIGAYHGRIEPTILALSQMKLFCIISRE